MKRLLAALVCVAALLPIGSPAEEDSTSPYVQPQPMKDSHIYDDLGMHLEFNKQYVLAKAIAVPYQSIPDHLQPFLSYVRARPYAVQVTVFEEAFPQDVPSSAGFEVTFENELRGAVDGAIVRSKKPITLGNGYPAMFVDITAGDGFNAMKTYAYVWADGFRGVVVEVSGRVGELDADTAKQIFTASSAVQFPVGRLERPQR